MSKIADHVFKGCTQIKSVVFPDGLEEIGEEAFEGCSALRSVSFPDSVTSLGDSGTTIVYLIQLVFELAVFIYVCKNVWTKTDRSEVLEKWQRLLP